MLRFLLCWAFLGLAMVSSCKKDTVSYIKYTVINKKVKVSDVAPLSVDFNEDGRIDFVYFLQYVSMSGKVSLYTGVNPIAGARTHALSGDDGTFLNMGPVVAFSARQSIHGGLTWTDEHSYLSVRDEHMNGDWTYYGQWSAGLEKMMALQFISNGKTYYGWARLIFSRSTEELMVVDAAWNTIPEQAIKAGAK